MAANSNLCKKCKKKPIQRQGRNYCSTCWKEVWSEYEAKKNQYETLTKSCAK